MVLLLLEAMMNSEKKEWWRFDSREESFDKRNREYVLKLPFPRKEEFEEWVDDELSDETYKRICNLIVTYFCDPYFISECFEVPNPLDPALLKKVGLENWKNDDLFEEDGYALFVDKLGGDWEVNASERDVTLKWQVPEWFGEDGNYCLSETIFLFHIIRDNIMISFMNPKTDLDLSEIMDRSNLTEVYKMLNKGQRELVEDGLKAEVWGRPNADDKYMLLAGLISRGLFQDKFMRGKNYEKIIDYFTDLPDKTMDPINVYRIYENVIQYFYWKREKEGYLDKTIKFCQESIDFSNKYIESRHRHNTFHHGYKQLSIIYNKQSEFEKAIKLSQEALDEGWGGDWSDRIDRNKKTWANKTKSMAIRLEKEYKYQEVIVLCQEMIDKGIDGDWDRRIKRCKPLIGTKSL